MRELFIDATRGLAGDMLGAALLGLFDDRDAMLARLNDLNIPGVRFALEQAASYSIAGLRLRVTVHGEEEGDEHTHYRHRSLGDVAAIVDSLRMEDAVKAQVMDVYRSVADAEGRVHGTSSELVHFHELGALDAIADISAACFLLHELQVDLVTASPICTGFGSVRAAHGLLPVPAPATVHLLEGLPCFAGELEGELCTPTGAALIRAFANLYSYAPPVTLRKQAFGLGKKDFGALSCVRTLLGESDTTAIELCCNVDDMSPEAVGFAIEELLRQGALDAWYEPIGMKKTRPGLLLCCLCEETQRDEMLRLIFKHTSTLGVRETLCRRYVLRRREETRTTDYGPVRVKTAEGYGVERRKAEFDDLARIARERGLSLRELEETLHDA